MTTALQLRRGTATQHADFTGLLAEVTVDTDYHSLRVHDGATKGGFLLAKLSDVQSAVRYDSSQTLTDAQKTQARSNIQAAMEPANLGLVVKTGTGSTSSVTLQQGKGISVQGGDGLTGNPTITNTGVTSINGKSGDVTLSFQQGEYQGGHGQVFTSSGTFTVPTGVSCIKVTVLGGGGGGGGSNGAGQFGLGGGAGGMAIKFITGLTAGSSYAVTVGGSGGGASAGNTGGSGGASSFGSFCSATGGSGGPRVAHTLNGDSTFSMVNGGSGSGGDINITGDGGYHTYGLSYLDRSTSTYGYCGGSGGSSLFGMGGKPRGSASGMAASGYGSGGSGGGSGFYSGGSGSPGLVIVEW